MYTDYEVELATFESKLMNNYNNYSVILQLYYNYTTISVNSYYFQPLIRKMRINMTPLSKWTYKILLYFVYCTELLQNICVYLQNFVTCSIFVLTFLLNML